MHVKRFLKSLIWLMAHPRSGLGRVGNVNIRRFAAGAHRSASLHDSGTPTVRGVAYIGRQSVFRISASGRLVLGEGVSVGQDCELVVSGYMEIGDRASLQSRSTLIGDVRIGAACVLAPNLYISSHQHHFTDRPALPIHLQDLGVEQRGERTQRSRPVTVGEDCWLGINVVVAPGVTIGRGCVVGANSVVTRDLPPYTVAAGTPARVLRPRLDFQPLRRIESSSPDHVPYFYAGFEPDLRLSVLQGEAPDAPRRARAAFCLAMATRPGDVLALDLDAPCAGSLRQGGLSTAVAPGRQTLHFPLQPDPAPYIHIEWMPSATHAPLDLYSAECVQP